MEKDEINTLKNPEKIVGLKQRGSAYILEWRP